MDPTISVSKGCFVFKNGATRADAKAKKAVKRKRTISKTSTCVLGKEITDQPFYRAYSQIWCDIQKHIERLQYQSCSRTLEELVDYVAKECKGNGYGMDTYDMKEILPTAALLTGINQPDHLEQFETLEQRISEKTSARVCVLQARDCPTLKAAVEAMVYNFVEIPHQDDEDRDHKRLRRSQCTMKQLRQWYRNNFEKIIRTEDSSPQNDSEGESDVSLSTLGDEISTEGSQALVVILPDFECFSPAVLQDFILLLSSYCSTMPFILVLGIATAVSAVHSTLPYHVTSKIKLQVFQTKPAPLGLNEILEEVILSPRYPFHLSGKTFKFLTHIFLYYDFSINGFIQSFKYSLMEHFFQGNAYALCCNYKDSLAHIRSMTHDDLEAVRRCLSFRPYVEAINDCKGIIAILTDDDYLKKKLPKLLRDCHKHFLMLRTFLEFFTELVGDLPKSPLGKLRRELYVTCLSKDLVAQPEFKECMQMLGFMSKGEFVAKVLKAVTVTEAYFKREVAGLELGSESGEVVQKTLTSVRELLAKVEQAGMQAVSPSAKLNNTSPDKLKQVTSRHDFKERLLQMSKQPKRPESEFSRSLRDTLEFIENEIVARFLVPLQRAPPLHELFVFADLATVRRNIIGAPRAALHMALNNPYFYLQCKCCELSDQAQLLATLPDLSVAYKLHLECGRMINLFDWLQAFRSVVDESDDGAGDELGQERIDPQIQARFTRAVAELQFLGYIKMSKRKTDHVTRLTW